MSLATSVQETRTGSLPESIESPTAKLVYLALDANGTATVDELRETLDLQKLVLFETLGTLESKGLVAADGRYYLTT
ncbi:MarR family transcriptional regulator [Natronoarchaeum mannanilyticum]|uniref:MarR family transcriptional regulator n=1 Tax=Natronoarchaeum mannanilyticum TaxID=926360 RepID=A0AAV3TAK1_9EURY